MNNNNSMNVRQINGRTKGMWKFYGRWAKSYNAKNARKVIPEMKLVAYDTSIIPGQNIRENGSILPWYGTIEAYLSYLPSISLNDAFDELTYVSSKTGLDFRGRMNVSISHYESSGFATLSVEEAKKNEFLGTVSVAHIPAVLTIWKRRELESICDELYDPMLAAGGGFETRGGGYYIKTENPRVIAVFKSDKFNHQEINWFYNAMIEYDNHIYRDFDTDKMLMQVQFRQRNTGGDKTLVVNLDYRGNK